MVLNELWHRSTKGDSEARSEWKLQGGLWEWDRCGLQVHGNGREWSSLAWTGWSDSQPGEQNVLAIQVTVSGEAEAAGLSFGDFKDFLVDPRLSSGSRNLRLELDASTRLWTFTADGDVIGRRWWDAHAETTDDLFSGTFCLKSRRAEAVTFTDLTVRTLPPVCHLSVIITCYRFAKRLRASLRNWCHQNLPAWSYEVLIVTPLTSDSDREYLEETCKQFPQVRQIYVEPELATNKGAMINRGIESSRGRWIWLTDADCLFAADSAWTTLHRLHANADCLYYGERWNLSKRWTDAILCQEVDPLAEFPQLTRGARTPTPDIGPYGFTQIAHRSVFERIRYREHINHFARTDDLFTDECKRLGLRICKVPGLYCLHLVHPFAWYGTDHLL